MSLAELKKSANQLSLTELEDLALHIEFLRRTADPKEREEALRRATVTKKWFTEQQVMDLHQRLTAEGL